MKYAGWWFESIQCRQPIRNKMINKASRLQVLLGVLFLALFVCIGVKNSPEIIPPECMQPDTICNPDNQPFVLECAFNNDSAIEDVTQEQFNERYLK